MIDFSWVQLLALVASGLAAGFLNTMAGGGSMLTLPALMLLGLPADVANGTNRVAVLTQSIAGAAAFRSQGMLDRRAVLPVVAPTVIGALIGSLVASRMPAWLLEPLLLGVMLLVGLVTVLDRGRSADAERETRPATHPAAFAALFGAGLYGGFVQAGVGFLLLAVLGGVMRLDLVRANALKLVCTGLFSSVSLLVFVLADQVAWVPGAVLGVATVVGSVLGVRVALRLPERVLRWIVFGAVLLVSAGALARS